MAMLRAFSTRRGRHGYERLLDVEVEEPGSCTGQVEAQLKRARSVPARVFGLSRKFISQELALPENSPVKKSSSTAKKKVTKSATSHPLFSLFDGRRKKKTTAKPEYARYLEYLREGGMWDKISNMPTEAALLVSSLLSFLECYQSQSGLVFSSTIMAEDLKGALTSRAPGTFEVSALLLEPPLTVNFVKVSVGLPGTSPEIFLFIKPSFEVSPLPFDRWVK
ncbi:hypothetical protein DITRI_Ditri18aG0108800 [Diplodiscus trichospermus]